MSRESLMNENLLEKIQNKENIINNAETTIKVSPKKFKTELCKNWLESGKCIFGSKCTFAHGKEEIQSKRKNSEKYKSKPCKSFHIQLFCPFGSHCIFQHDEKLQNPCIFPLYSIFLQFPSLKNQIGIQNWPNRLPVFLKLMTKELNNITKSQKFAIDSKYLLRVGELQII